MAYDVIETRYRNCKFRSRLEARWAVFFDTVGIEWEYEKEGFNLGKAGFYLPDFWLPKMKLWVEVKGRPYTKEELNKARALVESRNPTECNGMLLLEWINDYDYIKGYMRSYYGVEEAKYIFVYSTKPDMKIDPPLFCIAVENEEDLEVKPRANEFDKDVEDSVWMYTKGIAAAKSARFEYGETPQ